MLSKVRQKLHRQKKDDGDDSISNTADISNSTKDPADPPPAEPTSKSADAKTVSNSTMSDFNKILIIGATSGLGREFARRYHARGKKIIATGRRVERLEQLKKELPGIETIQVSQTPHGLPVKLVPNLYPRLPSHLSFEGVKMVR